MTTREITEADVHATWGDLFEVAVKRGCLSLLLHKGLLPDEPQLSPWDEAQVADLTRHLHGQLGITDPATRERYSHTLKHLLLQGWALGWTVLRSALGCLEGEDLQVIGLYCPYSLPERPTDEPDDHAHEAIWQALHLPGSPDPAWLRKGQPARADFLLWVREQRETGEHQHVFVLEFSLNASLEARDHQDQLAHLDETLAHASRLESRGVFTRIGASLTSDQFAFSDRIVSHLAALTTRDKPLYKLAQASAYATSFVRNLQERRYPILPITAHAVAITNQGIEALEAECTDPPSPRWATMQSLGEAYPKVRRTHDNDPQALNSEIENVRGQLIRALPPTLRDAVDEALVLTSPELGLNLTLAEDVPGFVNPATLEPLGRFIEGVEETPAVCSLLGTDQPRASLIQDLQSRSDVTLRDVHEAIFRRAITHAQEGQVTVIAAEGMPGIGKTTAVRTTLQGMEEGLLWFYASPRLMINEDVLQSVTESEDGHPSDVVALTTNSRIIGGANPWWRDKHPDEKGRRIDGAVLRRGADVSVPPRGSILFLNQDDAHEVDARFSGSNLKKRNIDESTDEMLQTPVGGVLSTLANATRELLDRNPGVKRLVLAASIQGFRNLARPNSGASLRSTVSRLSNLFHDRASSISGLTERREFAQRTGTIVVMVDEIAGDGAGAPFVHELGAWLYQEFIAPFRDVGETSPFRVVLVLADASLANDAVMTSYLEHRDGAPEKVIVSPSRGVLPFRVTAGDLMIGGHRYETLHVMADGFPARRLAIEYHISLAPVTRDPAERQKSIASRLLIAQQQGDLSRRDAVQHIFDALRTLPQDDQVIFFAQDKAFLRDIQQALLDEGTSLSDDLPPIETHGVHLTEREVAVLDSSVADVRRKELLDPRVRDRQRVFLMTSSGARGISFPRASVILGMVPRFSVESGLMEIAQLIFRGRGKGGDFLDRRLVMIVQDFIVSDGPIDERQWLRRTLDLLSALLLLRATIFTRILGDGGLPGQRAAIVPVGRIGADEVTTSLSQAVGPFLRESSLFLRGGKEPDLQGLVHNTAAGVEATFVDLDQSVRLLKGGASIVQPDFLAHLKRQITADHALLLERERPPVLPANIYMTGSLWLESWRGLDVRERYTLHGQTTAQLDRLEELRGGLHVIGKHHRRLPKALCRAARDLADILYRSEELQNRGFGVQRDQEAAQFWACVPFDYLSFCYDEGEHGRVVRRLADDAHPIWRDAMLRVVSAESSPLTVDPVIPRYEDRPFLTFQATGDPTGLERAFDGRYFMASSELNLVNTILFVSPEEWSSGPHASV